MIMETIEKKIKRRSTYVQDLARTQRASTKSQLANVDHC